MRRRYLYIIYFNDGDPCNEYVKTAKTYIFSTLKPKTKYSNKVSIPVNVRLLYTNNKKEREYYKTIKQVTIRREDLKLARRISEKQAFLEMI